MKNEDDRSKRANARKPVSVYQYPPKTADIRARAEALFNGNGRLLVKRPIAAPLFESLPITGHEEKRDS